MNNLGLYKTDHLGDLSSLRRPQIMAVHSIAQQGFGEGTNEIYDRARPSYQPSVLAHIHQSIPKERSSPFNVVEIGAGTGIFTRALLAHPDWSSCITEIQAVEPSAGMRAQFEKTVIGPYKESGELRISIKDGSFTETGVEDEWADIVFIAQAYHWAHPAYDAASVEFARILKPSGAVVYTWNLEGGPAWISQLRSLYESHENGAPQFRNELWRATFDSKQCPIYSTLFEPPVENTFETVIPTTIKGVIEKVRSKSYIAVLERERKEEFDRLTEGIRKILDSDKADIKWIDKDAGVFEYPYKTTVIIARKK
ncbi:S-adenosyl-L-methionine-dependent methyltransferase [Rhodocollybia butyracea]|uniref:S-adenosyl-L-methionine-dependent methyltransferase n=1 Tax=Rhodocollybia butyracea TaxID=206335 RepID=A0A9P5U951_9AGAR|nr:S-adenosyl-L-methionine-dependent methyltransferase [Rhodocollybia butyracea]